MPWRSRNFYDSSLLRISFKKYVTGSLLPFVNINHFVNACPVKENKDVTKSSYKKTIEKNHIRETDWSVEVADLAIISF
jgi:hypothetical protein